MMKKNDPSPEKHWKASASRSRKRSEAAKEQELREAAREKADKNILRITYAFAALFIGMCLYLGFFRWTVKLSSTAPTMPGWTASLTGL